MQATSSLQQAVEQIRVALSSYADSMRGMQETLARQQRALARMGQANGSVQAARPVAAVLAARAARA